MINDNSNKYQALVKKQDVTEIFREHLELEMNRLPETELTTCLD